MFGKDFSQVDIRRFTLSFADKILERRFQFKKMFSSMWFIKLSYYAGVLVFIVYSIVTVTTASKEDSYTLARFIASLILLAFCVFVNTRYFQKHYLLSNFIIIFLVIAFKVVSDYVRKTDGSITTGIFLLIISTFFIFDVQYIILLDLMLIAPFYARQYYNYHHLHVDDQHFYVLFSNYIIITSLAAVSLYMGIQLEKQTRNDFIASISIDNQNSIYDSILSILVPDFVKVLLNRGKLFSNSLSNSLC